jgi:hypothetical protein
MAGLTDKNELASPCLTPLGKGKTEGEKRSQLPFLRASNHTSALEQPSFSNS